MAAPSVTTRREGKPSLQPVNVETFEGLSLWREDGLTVRPAKDNYLLSNFLLRSSVFVANPGRHTLDAPPVLPIRPKPGTRGGILTAERTLAVRDLLLLGHVFQVFHRLGCPEDAFVPLTTKEAALAMGYPRVGGRQYRQARNAVDRLVHTLLVWTEWWPDGMAFWRRFRIVGGDAGIANLRTGLMERTGLFLSPDGLEIAQHTALTSLRQETARALVTRSEHAARLWLFLESEHIPGDGFDYHLFRASPGDEPAVTNAQTYIAEVLGMDHWRERKRVAQDLRAVIDTIHAVDGERWQLRLDTSSKTGMYTLHVQRHRRPRPELSTGGQDAVGPTGTTEVAEPRAVGRTGTDRWPDGYRPLAGRVPRIREPPANSRQI